MIRGIAIGILAALVAALSAPGCGRGPESQKSPQGAGAPVAAESPGKPGGDPEKAALLAEGKEAYKSCGACHCETDPGIPWDEDWVVMNEKTTCIEAGAPAPRLRQAIIAYLRDPGTYRPLLVDAGFKPAAGMKTGKISVPAIGGSAYLKASRESVKAGTPPMVRLYWGLEGPERDMVTPAGEYTVINYWLYKRGGKNGEERWSASVTNVDGCQDLVISGDGACRFETDPVVRGSFDVQRKEGAVGISFALYDVGGNRITISRNGKVVHPGFVVLDREKGEIGKGGFGVS